MEGSGVQRRGEGKGNEIALLRRFSSIKVNYEKERRRTVSRYQQQGLQISIGTPNVYLDKAGIRKKLRASVERYSLPELYVKMICALFPQTKSREMPDSNALIQHLKKVFKLNDTEHGRLMDVARMTKLPQRIINLEIVEARNIPAKDPNGLSDPFCVIFVNSRDVAQRTKMIPKTLNPVWKQYFTFKVNDLLRDVLHLEIMDYNDQDEPLKDRIRRFKEIKSPGTFGILLKEIANARSVQELIGTLKIPVSEISSETIEKWFKLRNQEDRGEIYLRMALGYNKSKEAASEEFLQIVHFLLVYELEKDTSLGTPFYWDEHYEVWSKYILRQFKWQGGLKPKDIVLAKWRAYTVVNSIFPLNANMMCLLMDAVLERTINCEYDTREVDRLWDCTVRLVDTIIAFIQELHDVLPSPVTVLHTYHMLKTLELLNQFLRQPETCDRGKPPFTKTEILERVTKAIRDGANNFYLKVFSDSTNETISSDDNPLNLALERLVKMGQILDEDLRLGQKTIYTDFTGILNVDYLAITYQVYDEQYGKMVKYIMEEYSSNLLESRDSETDDDESLDQNSLFVTTGLTVLKLYLSVKNVTDAAPPFYLEENEVSEFSLKRGLHDWFFHSVATWLDVLRRRVIKLVKNCISASEGNKSLSNDTSDTMLSKIDKQSVKDVPISPSALDTAQLLLELIKFWTSLGWENPHQSYVIARKILEELYGSLIYYASQLHLAIKKQKPSTVNSMDVVAVQNYLHKCCVGVNNINYVKDHVEVLGQQLNISEIIAKLELSEACSSNGDKDYDESIETIRTGMEQQVGKIIEDVMLGCVKVASVKLRHLLQEMSKQELVSKFYVKMSSSQWFKSILEYLDNCLITLKENLENQEFLQLLVMFWEDAVEGMNERVSIELEAGKTSEYFQRFSDLLHDIHSLFWPSRCRDDNLKTKIESPDVFQKYGDLKNRLSYLSSSLEDLKLEYYAKRYKRQMSTSSNTNEHGIITIRACFVEKNEKAVVEILNARKLKSYDSNNLSDPYAIASFVPKEHFPKAPSYTTKCQKETLYPLFEETFTFTITEDERRKGFLLITLLDYDFIGKDDLMGEAFLPLTDISKVPNASDIASLPQRNLALTKPIEDDVEYLEKFEERVWDKEAVKFVKMERDKVQKLV